MKCETTDTATLQAWYCNAEKTRWRALGHTKAAENERLANYYEAELRKRNAEVPSAETVRLTGEKNGAGAY